MSDPFSHQTIDRLEGELRSARERICGLETELERLRSSAPEVRVSIQRDVAEFCLESAMMLRKRLEIAPNSPEYRRVCEIQTKLENSLTPQRGEG